MSDRKELLEQYYDPSVANSTEFYFSKAQEALAAWRSLNIEELLLNRLVQLDYSDFKDLAETDPTVKPIRRASFY
ncbi:MAG: hypothetical protein J6U70_07515 [Bacteroidales bacterium]|nr:hypothetical protein [Bacteroidales bacterium]